MGIFWRLTEVRVPVTLFQASLPFFRTFNGNNTNVPQVLLWLVSGFLLDRLKEKLTVTCYLNLATENHAWQYRLVRLILDWGWGKMAVGRVAYGTFDFSGCVLDVAYLTGPLWTLLFIHAYLSASWKMSFKWHLTWPGRIETYWSVLLGTYLDSCFCKSLPILAQHHICSYFSTQCL